ncbi:MAG: polysaccharide deacetylase family protein [Pseudomonadota bacterium]|nr:polysaccharide deacetylase family protein [Pseudomonadota bacterium]
MTLASIHDVSPKHEAAVDRLLDLVASHCGTRLAMLVVPNFWAEAPLIPGSPFATRLRRWADAGIEMFLHGAYHRADRAQTTMIARIKASHMTAGEGEFLGLPQEEASKRIEAGRQLIEGITGTQITGFIAPAWLYGDGARAAMSDLGIALAEDHWRVWQPTTGTTLCRGPVITWASRTRARLASSLAFARVARVSPMPRVVRIGVHPGDCTSDRLLASIDTTLARFTRSHGVGRYADLVAPAA